MRFWDRTLLRGLRSHLPEDANVVALERGTADALGEMRKTTAVLTDDSLLLATSALAEIRFDDYAHARARVIQLDLKKYGDREGIIAKIRP